MGVPTFSDRRRSSAAADRAGSLDPREMACAVEHLDRRRGADCLGGLGRRRDRHRTGRAVHEQRGHGDACEPSGQAGQLGVQRRERRGVRLERERHVGEGRRGAKDRRSTPARAAASTPSGRPRCPGPPSPALPGARLAASELAGVRRIISASNSASPPSPTPPSGSITSAAETRSGCCASRYSSRCPPQEWPATTARSQARPSSTATTSATWVGTS